MSLKSLAKMERSRMMKSINKSLYLVVFICCMACIITLSSCGDDEPMNIRQSWLTGTYTSYPSGERHHNQLYITYNGDSLYGKTVYFELPYESTTASITLRDIIPGENKAQIDDVLLSEASNGKGYQFMGHYVSKKKKTICYSGVVDLGVLYLDLTE